jgi:hypothetical protein
MHGQLRRAGILVVCEVLMRSFKGQWYMKTKSQLSGTPVGEVSHELTLGVSRCVRIRAMCCGRGSARRKSCIGKSTITGYARKDSSSAFRKGREIGQVMAMRMPCDDRMGGRSVARPRDHAHPTFEARIKMLSPFHRFA